MYMNNDYITTEDIAKISYIYANYGIKFGEIGKMVGVNDSGYWSRILHGKKPVPQHVREKMVLFFDSYGEELRKFGK